MPFVGLPRRPAHTRCGGWCSRRLWGVAAAVVVVVTTEAFAPSTGSSVVPTTRRHAAEIWLAASSETMEESANDEDINNLSLLSLFEDFVQDLLAQQSAIVAELEGTVERESGATFGCDPWGCFAHTNDTNINISSGGITRVLQGGAAIEKGACSVTLIRNGVLTADRAATIRARQHPAQQSDQSSSTTSSTASVVPVEIQAGDTYSAVALSMVLHSRNPMVPTFRSDVRAFLVTHSNNTTQTTTTAWLGGGADLTPYYLFPSDIFSFHRAYQQLCETHSNTTSTVFSYPAMKDACDAYFFLPARQEHRGTGGVFFDDVPLTPASGAFARGLVQAWMPSWVPIVQRRTDTAYTDHHKHWQKIRRGRYLEFNLLYDVCSF